MKHDSIASGNALKACMAFLRFDDRGTYTFNAKGNFSNLIDIRKGGSLSVEFHINWQSGEFPHIECDDGCMKGFKVDRGYFSPAYDDFSFDETERELRVSGRAGEHKKRFNFKLNF